MEQSAPYRYFGALRFVLAVFVILQHFGSNIAPPLLHDAIYPLAVGSIAVLVFFALSGFIISEAAEISYQGRPAAFLVNRALRIVPPFLAALTATVLIDAALAATAGLVSLDPVEWPIPPDVFSWRNILWNYVSFLPGVQARDISYPFIVIIWTVRVEVLFYLVFALCLFLAARWRNRALAFAAAGLPTVLLVALQAVGRAPAIFMNAPYFIFGIAVYESLRGGRTARAIAAGAALAMLLGYPARLPDVPIPAAVLAIQYAIQITLFLAFWLLCTARPPIPRRVDQFLGDLSYPVYLNHLVIGVVFKSLVPVPGIVSFLTAIGLSLCFSYAMYLLIEPPLRRLRARVRGGARIGEGPPARAASGRAAY